MLEYEGVRKKVGPGQAMILHIPHANRYWHPPNWTPWEFIYITMHGQEILRIWRQIEKQAGHLVDLKDDAPVVKEAARIHRDVVNGALNSAFLVSARAYQFSMLAAQTLLSSSKAITPSSPVRKAAHYCQEHYSDPVSVQEMAQIAGYSRYHFSRLFKSSEGISPGEYLNHLRIKKAAELLQTTSLSVKEIANACGFHDLNYFCRTFRKALGVTPGSFRRSGMY